MVRRRIAPILVCILFARLPAQEPVIYINEFLASNSATNLSPHYSEYADWLELYNPGSDMVDISGYFLTDDFFDWTKWRVPQGTFLPASGYLLFWADDHDSLLHTNFRLNRDGEAIGLFQSDGSVVDTVTYGLQQADISFGRPGNDMAAWGHLYSPTPLAPNDTLIYNGVSLPPQFSAPGGFYRGDRKVSLAADAAAEVRYTLDGTEPELASDLFTSPIRLDRTTAVRARAFEDGKLASQIITMTYFIDDTVSLPVISLVTDPDNLFDDEIGIYVTGTNGRPGDCDPTIRNLNQDWERPVNVEFYETDGTVGFNQEAGIKIFGGCSRTRYPQKSFALYARSDYGKGAFNYQLFKDKPIDKFESFLLRSSADDQVSALMRDALAQTVLATDTEVDVDYQAYRPAVVYVNGDYWGIHNIREKITEHYLASNFDVDPDHVNILERDPYQSYNTWYGRAERYNTMLDFVRSQDVTMTENYAFVQAQMDIDQYIDYQIAHIYLAEKDWPGNNIKFWNTDVAKHLRWRWICFDMDQTFIHTETNALALAKESNGPGWPNPPWSTLLFRNLLENPDFRKQFILRYAFLLSTTFHPQRIQHIVDSLKTNIAAEIPRHIEKWGGQRDPDSNESWTPQATFESYEKWLANVDQIRLFAVERPQLAIDHLVGEFDLSGTAELMLQTNLPQAGRLEIENWQVPDSAYSAIYFQNITFAITAVPEPGYRFSHWQSGVFSSDSSRLEVSLTQDTLVVAFFEPDTMLEKDKIVINEINYNSATEFDTGDWLELHNRSDSTADLGNWILQDSDSEHEFIFPEGTTLERDSYLVVTGNKTAFLARFPDVDNLVGDFDFGFSSDGEATRLYSSDHVLVDSVRYENNTPWPPEANGGGVTLELREGALDNSVAQSWRASAEKYGSPGMANSVVSGVEENRSLTFALHDNYPNPFNPSTTIRFSIPLTGNVRLSVYDVLGQQIRVLVDEGMTGGQHRIEWDGTDAAGETVASGIYIYRLKSPDGTSISKTMLLMK